MGMVAMNRTSGRIGCAALTTLTCIVICCHAAEAAQTFGYTSIKPQLWETERPMLEQEPGTNLYWHDPFLGSKETCQYWPPATNGCMPSWYARTELLALYRDDKDRFDFATFGAQGPTAISTSSFDPEFRAGIRTTLGKTLGTWYRLEATYFGSYSWSDEAAVRNLDNNDQGGTGNLYSSLSNFGDPAGVPGLDYNNYVWSRFRSNLNNGELNLRRRILMRPGHYEASFLVGTRYLNIGEEFEFLTASSLPGPGVTTNNVLSETSNELIGVQIGFLSQFLVQPRLWIDFEMKGGIYHNDTSLVRDYTSIDGNGATSSFAGSDSRNRTSFVGDLSLQFNYQFARHWTFYGGYNVIWVTGLALGANNAALDADLLTLGPTLVDHGGDMVYHGPNLGLVFTY
jgi:hypothetical protein